MTLRIPVRTLALAATFVLSLAATAQAQDGPTERARLPGVGIPAGATTWADPDNSKREIIDSVAKDLGKTCTQYEHLAWASGGAGGAQHADSIRDPARANFEAAGFTIEEQTADAQRFWVARKGGDEVVALWEGLPDATIYLSCLTAGKPAVAPGLYLFLAMSFIVGPLLLLGALYWRNRTRKLHAASQAWPRAQGTVTSSALRTVRGKGGKQYYVSVGYDYAVDGKTYSGSRIRFGATNMAKAAADKDLAAYPVGAPVDVAYDPARPERAVLDTTADNGSFATWLFVIVGLMLIAFGIWGVAKLP